jgi:L-fuconolactonase
VKIVDSHCHAGLSWFEPVEMLVRQMESNDVDHGVLIQHRGVYDNSYLFDCVERFPGRFSVVAMVDVADGNASAELERWAGAGATGVRLAPVVRSPGTDPLAIWRKAAELGLAVSSLGTLEEFAAPEFAVLVAELSDLTVVVEHLAGAGYGSEPPYSAFRGAMELSRYDNTYIKVGGLGEISMRPDVLRSEFGFDNTPALIEMAYEAFGPRRMMWGSDYPPVSNREGYGNALRGIVEHPVLKGEADREWVMGKTAEKVFGTG